MKFDKIWKDMSYTKIRKLGIKESSIFNRTSSKNFVHTFLFTSKIDLYKNIEIIKNAIRKWKTLHSFLNARVIKEDNCEYYAIDLNCSVNKNLENVKFLKFVSSSDSKDPHILNELCILLAERELSNLITENSEILWRLTFLTIDHLNDDNEYFYQAILILNHSISEARNSYAIFYQLLNLVEDPNFEFKITRVLPPVEEILVEFPKENFNYLEAPKINRPYFNNFEKAKEISFRFPQILNNENILNGKFMSVSDNIIEFDLEYLLEFSKNANLKIRKFIIDEMLSTKLFEKCRNENVKVSSCLSLIVVIAFIRLYEKYDLGLNEIVYYDAICLRNFKNNLGLDGIDDEIMGYYIGGMMTTYKNKYNNPIDLINNFWIEAKQLSIAFHQRLKSEKDVFMGSFKPLGDQKQELNMHFGMSNIGRVKCSKTNLFNITESYFFANITESVYNRFFFNNITTIENRICSNFLFNAYGIEQSIIDDIIEFYFQILSLILN